MTITKYHPRSDYGKAQAAIDSDQCVCKAQKKPNINFCWDCWRELNELDKDLANELNFSRGEDRLDKYLECRTRLGYVGFEGD